MKLPSTKMRYPHTYNKAAFAFIGFLLTLFCLAGIAEADILPSGEPQILTAPIVEDDDVIALLSLNLGGHDVAVAAWSGMNQSEKQTLRDQAVRIAKMAQAAELEGLSSSPEVARILRWGISSFLADAWEKKISSGTDLSEEAVRSFYEANRQRYTDSGAVRYRKAVYPASRKDAAFRAKNALQKAPLSRLQNCVTVNWSEYDTIAQPLAGALRMSPAGVVMGPLEIPDGYVLYEVVEQRGEALLPFEKCKARVAEDMVRLAIMEKLEKLNSE